MVRDALFIILDGAPKEESFPTKKMIRPSLEFYFDYTLETTFLCNFPLSRQLTLYLFPLKRLQTGIRLAPHAQDLAPP